MKKEKNLQKKMRVSVFDLLSQPRHARAEEALRQCDVGGYAPLLLHGGWTVPPGRLDELEVRGESWYAACTAHFFRQVERVSEILALSDKELARALFDARRADGQDEAVPADSGALFERQSEAAGRVRTALVRRRSGGEGH